MLFTLLGCADGSAFTTKYTYQPRSALYARVEVVVSGRLEQGHRLASAADVRMTFFRNGETWTLSVETRDFSAFLAGDGPGATGEPFGPASLVALLSEHDAYDESRGSRTEVRDLVEIVLAVALGPGSAPPAVTSMVPVSTE